MQQLEKYTSLSYENSIITTGRIILVDENLTDTIRKNLQELETTDGNRLIFLDDIDLSIGMEKILGEIILKENNILLVFPGNGSKYPYRMSRICQDFPNKTSVMAKRIWEPESDPIVFAGAIQTRSFLETKSITIVVIDDVISSGMTMHKIHRNSAWHYSQARWIGVSWVAQIPQVKARSGIKGYEHVNTACLVGKPDGSRIPINSLSTLRKDPEIATSYARRHFKDHLNFLYLIMA